MLQNEFRLPPKEWPWRMAVWSSWLCCQFSSARSDPWGIIGNRRYALVSDWSILKSLRQNQSVMHTISIRYRLKLIRSSPVDLRKFSSERQASRFAMQLSRNTGTIWPTCICGLFRGSSKSHCLRVCARVRCCRKHIMDLPGRRVLWQKGSRLGLSVYVTQFASRVDRSLLFTPIPLTLSFFINPAFNDTDFFIDLASTCTIKWLYQSSFYIHYKIV